MPDDLTTFVDDAVTARIVILPAYAENAPDGYKAGAGGGAGGGPLGGGGGVGGGGASGDKAT